MKNLFTLTLLFATIALFAQTAPPQAFNYSAVVRNSAGTQMPNQNISVQFTIYKGTATGAVQYVETHAVTNM